MSISHAEVRGHPLLGFPSGRFSQLFCMLWAGPTVTTMCVAWICGRGKSWETLTFRIKSLTICTTVCTRA